MDKTNEAVKTVIAMLKPTKTNYVVSPSGTAIKTVPTDGKLLIEFIQAIHDNSFRKWELFKTVLSNLVCIDFNGRCGAPIKKRLPRHNQSFYLGSAYIQEKNGVGYLPQIPLQKCITVKQKVNMIMATDSSPEVKSDLIAGLGLVK